MGNFFAHPTKDPKIKIKTIKKEKENMGETTQIIQTRTSTRIFSDKPVTDELLGSVLRAVQSSQSWANTQCWEVIMVNDPEVRKQLRSTVPKKNTAAKSVETAPVLFALCAKKNQSGYFGDTPGSSLGDWYMYDIGIATQNLCLQAHELGLGTVVIGWLDHEKAQSILGIPDSHQLVTLIPMGFPKHPGKVTSRRAINEFLHYNRFEKRESAAPETTVA